MRLSEKKRNAIYRAVYDEIMDLRVSLNTRDMITKAVDFEIAQSIDKVAKSVTKVVEGAAP